MAVGNQQQAWANFLATQLNHFRNHFDFRLNAMEMRLSTMERFLTEQNQYLQAILSCLTNQPIQNGGNYAELSARGEHVEQTTAPAMDNLESSIPLIPIDDEESDSFRISGSEHGSNQSLSRADVQVKVESYGSIGNHAESANATFNNETKLHCAHCGQICSNSKTLRNHLLKYHFAVKNVLKKPAYGGKRKPNLKRISQLFPKSPAVPCASSSSYLNHQRWMNMNQHLILVDGKRYYRCPLCKQMIADRKTNFIRHLLTKHKIPATELILDSALAAADATAGESSKSD